MTVSEIATAPLVLPRVPPSDRRLGWVRRFLRLARNPLLVIPEAVYEDAIHVSTKLPVAYVCGPDLIGAVLLDHRADFPKDAIQKRVLGPLMGNGILISDEEDWRWQRRTVASLFRHADVLQYVPAMAAGAAFILDAWRETPPGSVQLIDRDMVRAAYHVIGNTILPSDHGEVTEAVGQGAAAFGAGVPWAIATSAMGLPAWVPHPGRRPMRRETVNLRRLVGDMIAARRAAPIDHDDLFSRLLGATDPETGRGMSDEQLIDNLLTFLLAGHDTTAKALTWALYLASQAPEWAERLRAEAVAVAGERPIADTDVSRLVLTQQFVKEAMRLFPPVPTITRIAAVDTELGGEPIRAGTLIVIPIYVIHRHRALWDEPDRFDPTRFVPERERTYPRNQFMPFGAGPRVCIGAAFAQVEATVVLATLIRSARFEYAGEAPPNPVSQVVLVPKGGMPMRVTLRDAE